MRALSSPQILRDFRVEHMPFIWLDPQISQNLLYLMLLSYEASITPPRTKFFEGINGFLNILLYLECADMSTCASNSVNMSPPGGKLETMVAENVHW